MKNSSSIDEYIQQFSPEVQQKLEQIRELGHKLAPKASEAMKYGIPTFVLTKNLFHFAAYKDHIGFYPAAEAIEVFSSKLQKFKTSKGAIQFPITEELPIKLIQEIIQFRIDAVS